MSDTVHHTTANGISTITMNRPKQLNALNGEMLGRLHQAVNNICKHKEQVRCVVIQGEGRHFMAGGDIAYFQTLMGQSQEELFHELISSLHRLVMRLAELPVPVIAKVRGAAAGFGISLVAGCDLAVASRDAFFTSAYNLLGTSPDGGSTYYLPRTVNMKKTMEIMLLTQRYSAQDALEMGLINQIADDDAALDEQVTKMTANIANSSKLAVKNTKILIRRSYENSLEMQLVLEQKCFLESAMTSDFSEGVNAFVEKRKPDFS